jgi:hypothetical protein
LRYPRLAAWAVLALGMIGLLVIEAREVGLLPGQWIALITACVLVAGACIWIVSWEDDDADAIDTTAADADTPGAGAASVNAPAVSAADQADPTPR